MGWQRKDDRVLEFILLIACLKSPKPLGLKSAFFLKEGLQDPQNCVWTKDPSFLMAEYTGEFYPALTNLDLSCNSFTCNHTFTNTAKLENDQMSRFISFVEDIFI